MKELATETDNVEEQLAALEKADEIERLLTEMKARRASGNNVLAPADHN